jgi:hypothetical protein
MQRLTASAEDAVRQGDRKVGVWSIFRPIPAVRYVTRGGRKHGPAPFTLDFAIVLGADGQAFAGFRCIGYDA